MFDPKILSPELIELLQDPKNMRILNEFEAMLLQFKRTPVVNVFLRRPENTIFFCTGNQFGKTAIVTYSYALRILGMHPLEYCNMRPHIPKGPLRTFRFASVTLPGDKDDSETKNTIYPALKKWLPPFLIKKDITSKNNNITIRDIQGGPDIIVEFCSYNQPDDTQAGVQRFSCYLDENAPRTFWEEQIPRLMMAKSMGYGGDMVMTLTPAEHLGWQFEDIYEKAKIYFRTPRVVKAFKTYLNKDVKVMETTDSKSDICVIQAATDDNPTMSNVPKHCTSAECATLEQKGIAPIFTKMPKDRLSFTPHKCNQCGMLSYGPIDEACLSYGDADTVAIRRYGIFKQVSGSIFKAFDARIHVIDGDKYFPYPSLIPNDWKHCRGIDYHTLKKWAVTWVVLSPQNEVFVYNEYDPDPNKNVTLQIANAINEMEDYHFKLDLIDPLSDTTQVNTGFTTLDDLNRIFREFRREGKSSGGFWQTWDTKSDRGRNEIKTRLANSLLCGVPFNNRQIRENKEFYLPTLWIFDKCINMIASLKNWKKEQWANREMLVTKDEKDKVEQKYSHFPMCLEGLFKHPSFSIFKYGEIKMPERKPVHYFNGDRVRQDKTRRRMIAVVRQIDKN